MEEIDTSSDYLADESVAVKLLSGF
jgi:hypothetical protein